MVLMILVMSQLLGCYSLSEVVVSTLCAIMPVIRCASENSLMPWPLSLYPRSTSTIHHAHPPNHKKAHRPPPASLRYTHPVSQDTHLVSERLPVSGTGHIGRQGWADLRSQLRAWVHSRSLLV